MNTYDAKENVWNVLSQPWSAFPRSSLGRGINFMGDISLAFVENKDVGVKRCLIRLNLASLKREDRFAGNAGGIRLK